MTEPSIFSRLVNLKHTFQLRKIKNLRVIINEYPDKSNNPGTRKIKLIVCLKRINWFWVNCLILNDIIIWCNPQGMRKSFLLRGVLLYYYYVRFNIGQHAEGCVRTYYANLHTYGSCTQQSVSTLACIHLTHNFAYIK